MKLPLLIIVLSFSLSACIPGVGKKDANEVQNLFLKGDIVAGFPPVPLYENAKIVESYTSIGTFGAFFVVEDELIDVVNFYNPAFKQTGWDAQLEQKSETNYVYKIKNAVYRGETIINTSSNGETTAITVSLTPR